MQTVTPDEARLELVGAVVKQAIIDLEDITPRIRDDAEEFLFSGRLLRFFKKVHLDSHLDMDYIKRKIKRKEVEYFLHKTHFLNRQHTLSI